MTITDLKSKHEADAARLLFEGFKEHWPNAWRTIESAREEVKDLLWKGVTKAAVIDGQLAGWAGAQAGYNGHVWELHPMVVDEAMRGRGVGRALTEAIEDEASRQGVSTLWLGTDDENEMTSLGGRDLYPDPLEALAGIRNVKRHPYEFYQRLGFKLVGVVPDANGRGKPDILMEKAVRPR